MTKEEKLAKECYEICKNKAISSDCELLYSTIKEFFDSNVCIPKGDNRHPYADVLHGWLENRVGVLQLRYSGAKDWDNDEDLSFSLMEYRIKPSEPVFEYQWIVIEHRQVKRTECYYISKLEVYENLKDVGVKDVCFPIEETKRVRK